MLVFFIMISLSATESLDKVESKIIRKLEHNKYDKVIDLCRQLRENSTDYNRRSQPFIFFEKAESLALRKVQEAEQKLSLCAPFRFSTYTYGIISILYALGKGAYDIYIMEPVDSALSLLQDTSAFGTGCYFLWKAYKNKEAVSDYNNALLVLSALRDQKSFVEMIVSNIDRIEKKVDTLIQ